MMGKISLLMLAALVTAGSAVALEDSVVAVVNDGVVLQSEVDDQVRLMLRQMGTQAAPTDAQYNALAQQALADLVDEELQRQLAEQERIRVTQKDLDTAVAIIENNNGLPPGGYQQFVAGLEQVASKKVAAEVRWQKLIAKLVQPKVVVSNAEVDRLINEMLNSQQVTEREMAQIFIAPAANEDEATTEHRVNEIYRQVQAGNVPFEQLARAYSNDAAARRGGVMGWFAPGEMLPALEQAAAHLQPGEVSQPVQGPQGWHILKVLRQRATQSVSTKPVEEIALWQLQVTPSGDEDTDKDNRRTLERQLRSLRSADDVKEFINDEISNPAFAESRDLGWQEPGKLSEAAQKALAKAPTGKTTRLLETPVGWTAYFVADRRTRMPENLEEYRTRVRQRLMDNRIDLEARKLLRDLRERAFIDVRL